MSLRELVPALCVLLVAGQLCAQGVELRASVDRSTVRENESFTYVLSMRGQGRDEPDLSPLSREFEILQRSRNTSIQMAGGRTTQVTEWRLQLMPQAAGTFTLPPLELAGAFSNPVEVQVLPAVVGETPGDVFMEVQALPATAYVQSEVIYTLRLFRAVNTGRSSLTTPEVTGAEAIVVALGEDREYQTVREGRNFIVLERRYAIFPQAAGELTVEPLTFEAVVITASGFSSLQRFRSDPVALTVRAAVAPPTEYADAAWLPARRVVVAERWSRDPDEFTVGIPQTRTLTVEGEGVLDTQLPELRLIQADGLKQYSDQPELGREAGAAGTLASRTERFAVIAQIVGPLTIPPVELPWFNVLEGAWEVARVEPRDVEVLPSEEEPIELAPPATATPAGATSGNEQLWQGVSAALLVAWLATVVLWLQGGRTRASAPSDVVANEPRRATHRQLLRELRTACSDDDARRARDLLLDWGALRLGEAPGSLGHLAAAAVPRDLAAAIIGLEESLYGPGQHEWDGAALRKALGQLDAVTRPKRDADDPDLLPLYR